MFKLSEDDGTFPHNTYVKMGSVHQRYSKHVMFFNILIGKEHERAKKKKKNSCSSTSLSHYGFYVAYLQPRELSDSICSVSTIYFPPENSQAVC